MAHFKQLQDIKEKHKKDIMAQYFNYGFDEGSLKQYIGQQVQKR